MSAIWTGPLVGLVLAGLALLAVRRRLTIEVSALADELTELQGLRAQLAEGTASLGALARPDGGDRSPPTRH